MRGRVVGGLILLALGILFILDEAGQIEFGAAIGRYWPVLLIVIGLVQLAHHPARPTGPIVLLVLGGFFLLQNLGFIRENWWGYFWPLILIVIGLGLLLTRGHGHHGRWHGPPTTTTSDDRLHRSAVLGGVDERVAAKPFRGGSVSTFMGGAKLDFRDSELPPEGADLEADAMLGGIEIIVPSTWSVQVSGSPFMGGVDNKTAKSGGPGPTLRVKATAFMGGVEIKN